MTLSKEKAQELLQEVRKMATFFGGGPSAPAAAHSGGNAYQPGAAPSRYRDPGIAKMQEALKALAQAVVTQLNPQDPNKQEAGGRDSFGDYFTKNYLRNSDVPSVEFSPDPTKTNVQDKDPRAASKLSWVMDTMQRIGGSKAENFVDGVWGPRTNASLINAYALAEGLLTLAKEFKLPVQSFTDTDLAFIKPAMHENNDIIPEDKHKYAPILADRINRIRMLYNELKHGILEIPKYRAFIENDKPYIHYKTQGFTPQQLEAIKQTYPQGFRIPLNENNDVGTITVDDLASVDTINKWLSQFQGTKQNPYNIVRLVINQISGGA